MSRTHPGVLTQHKIGQLWLVLVNDTSYTHCRQKLHMRRGRSCGWVWGAIEYTRIYTKPSELVSSRIDKWACPGLLPLRC